MATMNGIFFFTGMSPVICIPTPFHGRAPTPFGIQKKGSPLSSQSGFFNRRRPQYFQSNMTEGEPTKKSALTGKLAYTIFAAAFGSAFQHGYNTGVINAPQALIERWIGGVMSNRTSTEEDHKAAITAIWSVAVSIFCVGGMVGGCSVGIVAEKMGRKGGLLYNNIFVLFAALAQWMSRSSGSYELFIVGRFLIGVSSGLNAGLVPLYVTEVSPVSLRGAVGTVYQLVITISIMISNILGLESVLGTESNWPLLFAIMLIPSLFQVAMLPACPESPKYLLEKGRDEELKRMLSWLREGSSEDEFETMKSEQEADKTTSRITLKELLRNPSLRMPLIISSTVMVAQQLSGINAIMYFSTNIFRSAQLSDADAQYATLGMGILNVLMTFVSLFLVERAGRKTLLLAGFLGLFGSTLFLVFCMANITITGMSYLSVSAIFLFVLFFSIGPGSIPWFLVTELFSQSARPAATSVAVVVNWTANFLVGIGFLPLTSVLGTWVFLIFAVLQALFAAFIFKKVPETKNRTNEEIAAMFRQASYE